MDFLFRVGWLRLGWLTSNFGQPNVSAGARGALEVLRKLWSIGAIWNYQ